MVRRADFHDELKLVTRVASLYYLENKTQSEIAAEFHLSRQKVQRLLHEARAAGIVQTHIRTLPILYLELETRLKAAFSLYDVAITATPSDEALQLQSVARAAAAYLERYLSDGQAIAVGIGRALAEMAYNLSPQKAHCVFVSAMGGVPHLGKAVSPNDICRTLAASTGGRAESLYAPAFVESPQVRDILLGQEAVQQPLEHARRANIALVGIGGVEDASPLVRTGCLSIEQVQQLRAAGAVGHVLGICLDRDGHEVRSDLQDRLLGLALDDLRRIPLVIGVAAEAGRGPAILGALRAGVIDVLITSSDNAYDALQAAVPEAGAESSQGRGQWRRALRQHPQSALPHRTDDHETATRDGTNSIRRL